MCRLNETASARPDPPAPAPAGARGTRPRAVLAIQRLNSIYFIHTECTHGCCPTGAKSSAPRRCPPLNAEVQSPSDAAAAPGRPAQRHPLLVPDGNGKNRRCPGPARNARPSICPMLVRDDKSGPPPGIRIRGRQNGQPLTRLPRPIRAANATTPGPQPAAPATRQRGPPAPPRTRFAVSRTTTPGTAVLTSTHCPPLLPL